AGGGVPLGRGPRRRARRPAPATHDPPRHAHADRIPGRGAGAARPGGGRPPPAHRRPVAHRAAGGLRVGGARPAHPAPAARVGRGDLTRFTIAIDNRTGTTTLGLWDPPPAKVRVTHGLDEWLTLIAAGQAVGMTSEATANQNPRPGVAYRAVRDAEPIDVRLA